MPGVSLQLIPYLGKRVFLPLTQSHHSTQLATLVSKIYCHWPISSFASRPCLTSPQHLTRLIMRSCSYAWRHPVASRKHSSSLVQLVYLSDWSQLATFDETWLDSAYHRDQRSDLSSTVLHPLYGRHLPVTCKKLSDPSVIPSSLLPWCKTFTCSRVDYCNSLLVGLPKWRICVLVTNRCCIAEVNTLFLPEKGETKQWCYRWKIDCFLRPPVFGHQLSLLLFFLLLRVFVSNVSLWFDYDPYLILQI